MSEHVIYMCAEYAEPECMVCRKCLNNAEIKYDCRWCMSCEDQEYLHRHRYMQKAAHAHQQLCAPNFSPTARSMKRLGHPGPLHPTEVRHYTMVHGHGVTTYKLDHSLWKWNWWKTVLYMTVLVVDNIYLTLSMFPVNSNRLNISQTASDIQLLLFFWPHTFRDRAQYYMMDSVNSLQSSSNFKFCWEKPKLILAYSWTGRVLVFVTVIT